MSNLREYDELTYFEKNFVKGRFNDDIILNLKKLATVSIMDYLHIENRKEIDLSLMEKDGSIDIDADFKISIIYILNLYKKNNPNIKHIPIKDLYNDVLTNFKPANISIKTKHVYMNVSKNCNYTTDIDNLKYLNNACNYVLNELSNFIKELYNNINEKYNILYENVNCNEYIYDEYLSYNKRSIGFDISVIKEEVCNEVI